jgi:hemerythrin-like metal-binding protein
MSPEPTCRDQLNRIEPVAGPTYPAPHPPSFIVWRDEWTLNVDFMDEDHRCLAAILNHIAPDICRCAEGGWNWAIGARLLSRLETLGAHTREHFRREEQAMRASDYPAFVQHKAEHDLLLAEYTVMLRDIRSAGPQSLELGTLNALKQWLIGHVLDDDKALAEYLLSNAAAAAPAIAGLARRRLVVPAWQEPLTAGQADPLRTEVAGWR